MTKINSNPDGMLIAPGDLAARDDAVIVDCRFDLMNPTAGREAWQSGHIPGAWYADLDRDLASPRRPDSGRHPLPDADSFVRLLGSWGLSPGQLLVAYDDVGGAIAARLWWLLKCGGHHPVALLDGGLRAWEAAGLPLDQGQSQPADAVYPLATDGRATIVVAELQAGLAEGSLALMDARDPQRFAGGTEPIDPVAGHVPGALNRPFSLNLDADGRFLDRQTLRKQFEDMLDGGPAQVVSMCGSGVTACHNLFAMELAGLPPASLYVDSWSGWITDPDRPVARD